MAPVTEGQLASIRSQIGRLAVGSIRVAGVDVQDVDGPGGPTVLVTVILSSGTSEWDPDDFLEIRRTARTAALETLVGQDVRVVYESDAPPDPEVDEPAAGEKHADRAER